ncbi:MAG: glutaconate CoA-transferase [Roseovarius sp.]|nr:glutaconate CoA-transferase [Roseovarius sp.]MBK46016.1 glutaconate CoA-transferase [Roseovarius sp.]
MEERPELCLGGLFKQSRPVALVRALLATGADGLHVYSSPGAGYDIDLMIASGAVEQVFIPGVTLENRLCPNFRRAVEAGQVTAHALDALTVVGGLMAAAHGVPFQPVDALRGSDVLKYNPLLREIDCPFSGRRIHAVGPIRPSVTFLHAQEADRWGNLRHLSTMVYADQLMARASDMVIASVDRIVPDEVVLDDPSRVTVPSHYVDAVVEVPYGAHPTASFPNYAMDEKHIDAYADLGDAARTGDRKGLDAYITRHVTGPKSQGDYIEAVGGARHFAWLEAEARNR